MVPQNRTLKKYRMKKSPIIPQYRKPTCPPQEAKTFPSCVKYVVASSLVRINLMIDSFVVLICFSLMKISLVSQMNFEVARTYLYARWLCFWTAFFGREDLTDFYDF